MKCYLALFFLCLCAGLSAQRDTALLLPERLTKKNILDRDSSQQKLQAISATRSPEELEQIPFTVWVVTAEDILRYGYVTLGDVLRAAPGVRVSQPGNALEGETFLLRGLTGNEYVKILINDVPIKPSVAPGMPIGAQLPIRQAERIEVLYGPAASIYGNEACAGVVNIILKETERPVFTQADLSFGNYGYNSLDLMFGGKIGKDKRIFRFSLYGSSTVRETTNLFYDATLFNTDNYLPHRVDAGLYRNLPNYRWSGSDTSQAKLAAVPHESRLFGVNLTWRGMHFTYHRMGRFDHSALGLNPLAVGWYNPANRLAEQLETFSLGFQRQRKHRITYNTFSAVRYKVNNTSTTTYVFDRLSAAAYQVLLPTAPSDSSLRRLLYDRLASEERYAVADGLDLRFESRMVVTLRPNLFLQTGGQFMIGGGTPLNTYYATPVDVRLDGTYEPADPIPFGPQGFNTLETALHAQLEWRGKRLFLLGGAALNWMLEYPLVPAPRLAALYRIDSSWTVRGNFATGLRRPTLYAGVNNYQISNDYQNKLVRVGISEALATEKTFAGELGVRYTRPELRAEGSFFYQEAHHLLREGYLRLSPGIVPTWQYGFANAPGLSMALWGIQGLFTWENDGLKFMRKQRPPLIINWRTEVFAQYSRGREWFGPDFPASDDVRNMPRWMLQFRTSWRTDRFDLMLSSNRQQKALSKAVTWRDVADRPVTRTRYPAFRTWDAMVRFNLSDHFLVYFHAQNIFDRHYAGLDATGTPDDLLYNPQPGRVVRIGVNYTMNVRFKRKDPEELEKPLGRAAPDEEF